MCERPRVGANDPLPRFAREELIQHQERQNHELYRSDGKAATRAQDGRGPDAWAAADAADALATGGTHALVDVPRDQRGGFGSGEFARRVHTSLGRRAGQRGHERSSIEIELGTSPATITLLQGQLELDNSAYPTTIYDGPGEGAVTISGNSASRVFQVDGGVTASISGLTITGGLHARLRRWGCTATAAQPF